MPIANTLVVRLRILQFANCWFGVIDPFKQVLQKLQFVSFFVDFESMFHTHRG